MPSLQIAFYIGAVLSALAAVFSALRGEKYIHEHRETEIEPDTTLIGEKADLGKRN